MATLYDKIQALANQGRPKAQVGQDANGTPIGARSSTIPQTFKNRLGNDATSQLNSTFGLDNPLVTDQSPQVNQAYAPSASQKAQQELNQQTKTAENRRLKGRASTLLTGSTGLLDSPSVSRRSLFGL